MSGVLAVDLGGTKTAMALVNVHGRVTGKTKVPAVHTLEQTVDQVAERAGEASAIGVIVPGIYDPRNGKAWAPNLWGHDYVSLRDALAERISVTVAIGSDRTGYVLGEEWLGVARGCRDIVFVAVGTGIGVGIISNGRVIEGAHGIAGAAGWMVLDRAWKPEYAHAGCWESEAAGPGVARRAGVESAEAVVAAARAGDLRAIEVMRETAEYLAMGIANLISVLDPEMVVLGGGLMQAGDLLLGEIRSRVSRWAQPVTVKLAKIELTKLGEDAGLLGAARLAYLKD
jgi:glucokinase